MAELREWGVVPENVLGFTPIVVQTKYHNLPLDKKPLGQMTMQSTSFIDPQMALRCQSGFYLFLSISHYCDSWDIHPLFVRWCFMEYPVKPSQKCWFFMGFTMNISR